MRVEGCWPCRGQVPLNTRQWQSVYSIQLTLVMQDVTLNTIQRGVLEAVSGQAHNLEVGGSIPPVATNLACCINTAQDNRLWLTHNHK